VRLPGYDEWLYRQEERYWQDEDEPDEEDLELEEIDRRIDDEKEGEHVHACIA
jgi:hypothetical protein